MAGQPFRATFIWGSIISNLQSSVEVKRRRHNLKSYQDCFLGSEAVDVVLAHVIQSRFCGDAEVPRSKAVRLCQALMDSHVFEGVGTGVFGKEKRSPTFQDSSCSLYRFLRPGSASSRISSSRSSSTLESSFDTPNIDRNSYSSPTERPELPIYITHSPVKTDKSLEEVLGQLCVSSTITPHMAHLGLSQEVVDEVWRQQAVSRLLQLIELPLVEDLLQSSPRPSHTAPLHGLDSKPDLLSSSSYLDREVLKAFSEAQADEWLSAAVDCLEFLPDQLVVEVSRALACCSEDRSQSKRLLYGLLSREYGDTQRPPLLCNHVFDIHTGISDLLVNGKQQKALEAVQVCVRLQDAHSREELRRLLRFMSVAAKPQEVKLHTEIENRMAVKRSFSRAIVCSARLAKGKVDLMVLFLLDNHSELFKIPVSLHKLVGNRLSDIVKGKYADVNTGPSFCSQVSGKAFEENSHQTTKEELWSLLRTITENSRLSPKEKKRLLGQFYKGHPEIFIQYFGSRIRS